jgi:hypothetical protein
MRRLFRTIFLLSLAALCIAVALHFSVFAHRVAKDLASSQSGSSGTAGDCSDEFPTPFAAVLNGQVTPTESNGSACTNYTGTYPDYSLTLAASDKSFAVKVTPVLWGGGNADSTILHIEFSSSIPTLSLQSFVIGGLTFDGQTATTGPSYVACDFSQTSTSASPSLYFLPVISDSQGGTFDACTQPTMEAPNATIGIVGSASVIQPTPIQFTDKNTTRWDVDGLTGSTDPPTTLPSVDLFVPGVPSDLFSALNTSASKNNLTSGFMAGQSNFLAIAFDSSTNKTVTAGGLSIPNLTEELTNDSVSTATVVDATMAISANGFVDQVNTVGATPQEGSDGSFLDSPTNPADPTLSGATCFGGGADSPIFRTVWYAFTPIADGTVTIDTAKSRYDTVLAVFTGSPGGLSLWACDDNVEDSNGITHLQAMVGNVPVTHGTPYLILIGESPTQIGYLNDSTGNATNQKVAAPLSNDAALFLSVVETPAPAALSLNPVSGTALTFKPQQVGVASSSQEIKVTSSGGAPLSISNIVVPEEFTSTTTCSGPLVQGAQCEIDVALNPTIAGPVSGNLTFTDNVSGSSPSYPLSGTGVDFAFPAPAVTSGTLTSTSNAVYNLSVSGSIAFDNPVTFACSGLPTNTQCSFAPNPAKPGGKSTAVTLTVSRVSQTASQTSQVLPMRALAGLATLSFLLFFRKNWKNQTKCLPIALLLCSLAFMFSCGGSGPHPNPPPTKSVPPSPGDYTFAVKATSSGHSAPEVDLTLTVQ